jgi:hypothetical protein
MSGGHYDYIQRNILIIRDSIKSELDNQGMAKPLYERWDDEDINYPSYSIEVADKMREAIDSLERAYVFAQRVDYLLSGDDGEESFLKRLADDLEILKR